MTANSEVLNNLRTRIFKALEKLFVPEEELAQQEQRGVSYDRVDQ